MSAVTKNEPDSIEREVLFLTYPVPANEGERIGELRRLRADEWGYSPALDRLCSIASKQLRTPIALVSLVGETEQHFPAKIGLDADRTSREVAFCAHAIMTSEPLIVENAADDARFANNPLVTGAPGIAAYAGIPLETSPGVRLGTFCAIDLQPRKFTADEVALLSELSHIAISIMESHRTKLLLNDQLQKSISMQAKLAESKMRYDLCVRGSSVGLWDWDVASNALFWSNRFKQIVGIADEAFVPTLSSFEDRLHPEDHDRIMDCLWRHLQLGENYDVEYRLRRETGDYVWIHARGQAVWDDAGNPTRMAGSVDDITDRKSTEFQLTHYTSELERSNQELDQFAYVASHDLKAPLRVIENASLWLEEDLEDKLSDQERKYLGLLRNRVQRMDKLLDDLLDYSRVGRVTDDRHREVVSGTRLVDDILALLAPPPSFKVELSPEFAAIWVARMPLQQVLYNLINNAIKHHDCDSGTITLEVERSAGHFRFTVRDDGPGIPPEYQQQIFEMFRKLKSQDEVGGSGMGLALVKKTVEYFGGEIAVLSGIERGAAFTFTWPSEPEAIASGAAA